MAKLSISLFDRLRAPYALTIAFWNAWLMLLLRKGPSNKSYLLQFIYAFARALGNNSTIGLDRLLNPANGTEKAYLDFAKRKGFQPDTLVVDGTKAHWLGPKNAERVFLYIHGGGFVLPCLPGHVLWLHRWAEKASQTKSTAVLLLSYSLAPESQYPVQITQAVTILNHLLKNTGRRPGQIIIGGDSAGGNLTLAVLSHLLHPHPRVPLKIDLDEPLGGALLISPWVNLQSKDATFRANLHTDIIADNQFGRWSNAYRGSVPFDNYTLFSQVDDSWFKGLDKKVDQVWMWAGSIERLIGSINLFSVTLKKAYPKLDYFIEDGAVHDDFFIDGSFTAAKETKGTQKIEAWISSV